MYFNIEKIKNQVNLVDFINRDEQLSKISNDEWRGGHLARHPSESGNCLSVNDTKQVFHCFHCGAGGDIFSYVMDRDYCDFVEAVKLVCDTCNIPQPDWTPKEKDSYRRKRQEEKDVRDLIKECFRFYHSNMTDKQRQYLYDRGLTDETINNEWIGYATDSSDTLVEHMVKKHGGSEETISLLLKTGLFFKFDDGTIRDRYQNRYVFPYWYRDDIVFSIGRSIDPKVEDYKKYVKHLTHDKYPYVSDVAVKHIIWGEDLIRGKKEIILTEGVFDALLAKQIGYNVISPFTTQLSHAQNERIAEICGKADTVYVINDNEKSGAGLDGAKKTAIVLTKAGVDAKIATIPRPEDVEKIDLADFIKSSGESAKEEFDKLLKKAVDPFTFELYQIDKDIDSYRIYDKLDSIIQDMVEAELSEAKIRDWILHPVRDYFDLTIRETDNYKNIIREHIQQRKDKEEQQKEREQKVEGRHFGNIYEIDGYDANGNRQIGYFKLLKDKVRRISTFIIKPKSKLWIDGYEAINADFVSADKKVSDVVIERQNWNSSDSFMSVIPSTDMNWSGESRRDVQAVMSIVSSYDVPVQTATRQVGWHSGQSSKGAGNQGSKLSAKPLIRSPAIWVAPNLNMESSGLIEPVKVFYYPMGRHNIIDDIVSYKECSDKRFKELQNQAKLLLELNDYEVMIPIISWFHAAFTKRWFLDYSNFSHFPHLNVAGSRGSGKSTLIEILWRVFGWTGDALPNCSATRFALLRTFSATNSYPIVLDEFKPANMPTYAVGNLKEFMRHSYGGAVDQRGRPDQSIVEYHLTTPICLVGETPYYPLEAAAIERVIPVHMTINAIKKETELGKRRIELCYQLQQIDWSGYLPRYIRYLMDVDFDSQMKYAREDALRYLNGRDVPRRIEDNITAMIFGLRQYENFASVYVEETELSDAVGEIARNLCGEAGKRGKLAFEMALEQMAVMAEVGRLQPEVHYLIDGNQIALRLSACLSEFRKFARETNWSGEILDDNAYRRQVAEIHEEGRLVIETTKTVRGWQGDWNKIARAVIIDTNAKSVDLSGFLLTKRDEELDR